MGDLWSIVPAITGKIELVYEGEQEGPEKVAGHLLGQAVRNVFAELFPDAAKARKRKADAGADAYASIVDHFSEAHCDLLLDRGEQEHEAVLRSIPGLLQLVAERHPYLDAEEQVLWAEFVLHGLAEHSRIGRSRLVGAVRFGDLMRSVLGGVLDADEEA
jgi:magnesium chelatase subunit I